ncbi:MAG: glucose 1-dehydrogenase [SAR324 cluster bacterium]|nr:glucose 1-dehydrogenase [SAR324 cluster bacterium]
MERLKGKVAVVTGAAAGIGREICLRLAREGATVVGMDREWAGVESVAEEVRAQGGVAHALAGDVSIGADCAQVHAWVDEQLGAVQVLCNVAGIVDTGTLVEASEESWQRTMDINLKGIYHMCRLFVPFLTASGGGSIVNIASVAGPFAVKERGVYSVSKAGVIGLTKSLAIDFIGEGIRANAICPGTVETPSWRERVNQAPDPERALRDFIARQPMGRLGQPEEIAALAAYLASDEAAYMTGQAIAIDGGMTM